MELPKFLTDVDVRSFSIHGQTSSKYFSNSDKKKSDYLRLFTGELE